MYTWDDDASSWYGSGKYAYSPDAAERRRDDAARAAAVGPRTYSRRGEPNPKVVDPKKRVSSDSANPLIIAVDVTGSMASWPFEIFDRLPLLYNTLSQYRADLQVCFAAVGDAHCDRWPLQVTTFASGFDLEQLLGSLYGEGGGGDAPESYGLLAHWIDTHVEIRDLEEKPFLIVYGDISMHPKVSKQEIDGLLGDAVPRDVDSVEAWRRVSSRWNPWFLRRPGGRQGDEVDRQWGKAIGDQKIIHIQDEQRAVDYAMGLIARAWGHFGDFQDNMRARHSEDKVKALSEPIAMKCPRCGGPIPTDASGMFACGYCGMTLKI
jgi:ribosomal protein S27AE